jgi:uncharacterized membrane protein YphA (DoxX/SURF4 family)
MAGIILVVSGYMKFANGIGGFVTFMTNAGFPLPGVLGPFIATLELVGGLLLLVGLGTRWLGVLFVVEFIVTSFVVKSPFRVWNDTRIDLMLLAAAVLVVLAGPGKAAVDEMLAKRKGEPVRVTA